MDRKTGRNLAQTTLQNLNIFDAVLRSEPEVFTDTQFAVVHSKSLGLIEDARDDYTSPAEIWVTVYVLRPKGQGDATEDTLDDLVRASVQALAEAFKNESKQLKIGPGDAGYPPKAVDGRAYRLERFPMRFEDDD